MAFVKLSLLLGATLPFAGAAGEQCSLLHGAVASSYIDGKCVSLYNVVVPFAQAAPHCTSRNATLAAVDTPVVLTEVGLLVGGAVTAKSLKNFPWVGLRLNTSSSKWSWQLTGAYLAGSSPLWASLEPAAGSSCGYVKQGGLGGLNCTTGIAAVACEACPQGWRAVGKECEVVRCAVNEYVKDFVCTACAQGYRSAAGAEATLGSTSCTPNVCRCPNGIGTVGVRCPVNDAFSCTQCNVGAALTGTAPNATCEVTYCEKNTRVANNTCVACPDGVLNGKGDDATGGDTQCDGAATCSELTLAEADQAPAGLVPDSLVQGVQKDWRYSFSPNRLMNVCSRLDDLKSADSQFEMCGKFCGKRAVPMVLGSQASGLNLGGLSDVCLTGGLLKSDWAMMEECAKSTAYEQFKSTVASFVAALKVTSAAQLAQRKRVRDQVAAVATVLADDKTAELLDLSNDKAKDVQSLYTLLVAAGKGDSSDIKSAWQSLGVAAQELSDLGPNLLIQVQEFMNNCNTYFVGVSARKEFALNMCWVTGTRCLEHEKAKDLSCCCAYNPAVALGSAVTPGEGGMGEDLLYVIPGKAGLAEPVPVRRRLLAQDRRTSTTLRRVATQGSERRTAAATNTADVCSRAVSASAAKVASFTAQLNDGVSQQMLTENVQELQKRYGDCCVGCNNPQRRLQAEAEIPSPREPEPRQLQASSPSPAPTNSLSCPQEQTIGEFKSILHPEANTKPCQWTQLATMEAKTAACQSFCGTGNLPFLIGTSSFGSTAAVAEQICVKSGIVDANTTLPGQCAAWAKGFNRVRDSMSALLSAMLVFEAAQKLFQSGIVLKNKEVRDSLQSEAVRLEISLADDKAAVFKRLYKQLFEGSKGRKEFIAAAAALTAQAAELAGKLSSGVADLLLFLDNCDKPILGTKADGTFLMDMCSVSGTRCSDHESAERVMCCCGVNPVTQLGSDVDRISIPGNLTSRRLEEDEQDEELVGMTIPEARKLKDRLLQQASDQAQSVVYDMCSESRVQARADIKTYAGLALEWGAAVDFTDTESSCFEFTWNPTPAPGSPAPTPPTTAGAIQSAVSASLLAALVGMRM